MNPALVLGSATGENLRSALTSPFFEKRCPTFIVFDKADPVAFFFCSVAREPLMTGHRVIRSTGHRIPAAYPRQEMRAYGSRHQAAVQAVGCCSPQSLFFHGAGEEGRGRGGGGGGMGRGEGQGGGKVAVRVPPAPASGLLGSPPVRGNGRVPGVRGSCM